MKNLWKEQKQWILTIGLSILVLVFSMSVCRKIVFNQPIVEKGFYYFTLFSFAILVVIISYFIVKFVRNLIQGDTFSKKISKHFLIYFGIMFVFLLTIWPGYWVWDEIWVIDAISSGTMYTWQSIITQLCYEYAMLIIPSPVGITIIQTIIISLCVAFLQTKIEEKFQKKRYNVILYIIFLLPAILINNLYALRLQLYAYILLVVITNLIFDYWGKKNLKKEKAIFLYFLTALLILWRSEGMIFLILMPILMAFAYPNVRKISAIIAMVILNVVTFIGYSKAVPSDSRYQTIIFMNPLSVMLQNELKGEKVEEDLEKIDKVMDVSLLKENPSYTETPAYWNYQATIFREDYKQHMKGFYQGYIDLILHNPIEFLKARMQTFLASSGMDSSYREAGAFTIYFSKSSENKAIEEFLEKYPEMKPINRTLKVNIETSLLGNEKVKDTIIRPVFWNVIPVLIIMFVIMIERFLKKDYLISAIIVALFAKTAVVFLTAPASYFMYYLPEYICGLAIIAITSYKKIEEKKKNTSI